MGGGWTSRHLYTTLTLLRSTDADLHTGAPRLFLRDSFLYYRLRLWWRLLLRPLVRQPRGPRCLLALPVLG